MSRLPQGYVVRLATVRKSRKTFVECIYRDRQGEKPITCSIPHPYAGPSGGGIFVGIEVGTTVLIAMAPGERPHIVGIIPERGLYFDQGGVDNSPLLSTEYPDVEEGEIRIKSSVGSTINLLSNGDITLDAGIGDSAADLELSNSTKTFFVRTDNVYKFTEAGREIEGIIKRNKNKLEPKGDTNTLNFLTDGVYSGILTDIGRSPKDEVQYRTTSVSKSTTRNPALIEKRNIVYEYANSYGVRVFPFEALTMSRITQQNIEEAANFSKIDPSNRENRRTDILNLNHRNYNHLIEKVEGTVVDIYGNVLDINRNTIVIPEVESFDSSSNNVLAESSLRRAYAFIRRSIKYHFEINSRKELNEIEPSVENPGNNAKEHSRWSIDVDGEGLTKINIPASSETGNIPVLGRYVVSRNTEDDEKRDDGRFRDPEGKDIRVLQFGAQHEDGYFSGQQISDSGYRPTSVVGKDVTAGTGYHDLFKIASSILSSGGKLRNPNPGLGAATVAPMVEEINNKIPDLVDGVYYPPDKSQDANAGGRSIHANLDGSLEMSIGADTADRKSVVLDLAGGVISHYGRDRNGRSLIHQTDGDVIIQVGGPGVKDNRFTETIDTEDRPGRVEIHLNRPGSAKNQRIIIDEDGITIDVFGNGIFKTTGNLTISAGGKLLLHGQSIHTYGSVDDSVDGTRSFRGGEREISRKGRLI